MKYGFSIKDYPELYELYKRLEKEYEQVAEQGLFLARKLDQLKKQLNELSQPKWDAIHEKMVELKLVPYGTSESDMSYKTDPDDPRIPVYFEKKSDGDPLSMLKRLLRD